MEVTYENNLKCIVYIMRTFFFYKKRKKSYLGYDYDIHIINILYLRIYKSNQHFITISISRILFVQLTQYYTQGKFTYMLSFYIHFFLFEYG